MTMKENKTQFTTEDTLRAVKESIQDSMYENNKTLGRLLNEIGDRLANVVENFQSKQSLRDRDRDRSHSRGRNSLRDDYKNRKIEIEMTLETIQQTTTGIEIKVGLTPEMEEVKEQNTKDLE